MEQHNRKEPEVKWYVAKSARLSLPYRDELDRSGLEYFLPTRFVLQNIGGKRMRVERPVIFNFIFIRGTVFQVKEFCRSQQGIYMVYRHQSKDDMPADDSNRLLTVGDREMQMFAQTVGEYVSDVPFIRPSEVDLSKGDHVRIMDGPFAGVEGILISQQGKDGGRVLVSISNIISVPTLEIRPEFLQVISFAKSGRHLYKKFDSFAAKARRALRNYHTTGLQPKDIAALTMFVRRFSTLQTHTLNARVKLLVSLLVCYTCLGMKQEKQAVASSIDDILPSINSDMFLTFALIHLYACTSKTSYIDRAEEIISRWGTLSDKEKAKRDIADDCTFYRSNVKITNHL